MSNSGDDRSVNIGRDAVGNQITTGDNATAKMDARIDLPPPESVDPQRELKALRSALAALTGEDADKVDRAMADAQDEAKKSEPDRDEIGSALERALGYAKKAGDFNAQVEKIAPNIKAMASWLGQNWHKILATVGLST